jgi:CheY-like chemotaxis protein
MDARNWIVCVIEPNKFERQIIFDLLRQAGVEKIRCMEDADEALEVLETFRANVVISSFEAAKHDAAAVFITSSAFSRTMEEQCRHAGANALIGKPLSAKVLIATIRKVLTQPREFIDAEGYVGPCRRAGIVTAGAPKKRRAADGAKAAQTLTLEQALSALSLAAEQFGRSGAGQNLRGRAALRASLRGQCSRRAFDARLRGVRAADRGAKRRA